MDNTAVRQELHTFIDNMPEQSLSALKPLLAYMTCSAGTTLETDLTTEEQNLIEEGLRGYAQNPGDFIPLEDIA
ncbi:hypothetical protein NO2_1603 [Candidatus Termititenax persephonae]|uniref:Uncharacterized protein n=1 Tax=Candidatus Termititenax persephonae TaxID=2218525 RepID=A0A388TJH3_9BACT|nr:hypothetical protein NO2_1603 [Candidatus Termititenax persephonae]